MTKEVMRGRSPGHYSGCSQHSAVTIHKIRAPLELCGTQPAQPYVSAQLTSSD